MNCIGHPQMSPGPLDSEAAQLHIRDFFKGDFLRRHPDGIVISELEYMGRTTFPSATPTPLRIRGKSQINEILDALSQDFRRWVKKNDYRKCDILGIADDGLTAELLEVTTAENQLSAITQVNSKIDILTRTVNRIHKLHVDWRPSNWKPAPGQMYRLLELSPIRQRYICYQPTFRRAAPPGVILYEIHVVQPKPVCVPQRFKERARSALRELKDMDQKAKEFLRENDDTSDWVKGLAIVAGGALIIVAAIDPIPGDEIAAAAFAESLIAASR